MIKSFRCKDTQALFEGRSLRCFQAIEPVATRRLHLLDKARDLQRDIGGIPGNRLEKLHGDRAGQWSIRINKQWRVCFTWRKGEVFDVEITDYH